MTTTKNQTAIRAAESESDSFEPLYERYLSILCNLQLLVLALDMQLVPNEIHPAIRVLGETTKEAEQFFEDLQIWAAYDRQPTKPPQAVQS